MKNILGIFLACAAGFFGGMLSTASRVAASPEETVRATRFELVNSAGVPVGRWDVASDNTVRLSLISEKKERLQIGLLGTGRSFLRMAGRDGKDRVVIELDQADKPMLGMGDERWEGRVHLGFLPPDTFPYGDWDNWGLSFRGMGSQRSVAGMGMLKKDGRTEGFLTISGKNIR